MACREILEYPDPRLRTRARAVTSYGLELQALIDDLFETMYAKGAIGLAATQVNVHQCVVVLDVSGDASDPQAFINPQILARRGLGMVEEGCLSLPGLYDSVRRALSITIRAVDRTGATYERELEGLLAVCLQHEMDHLSGVLFVDRLPLLRRLRVRRGLARALGAAARVTSATA
jgi:peptide deformylase